MVDESVSVSHSTASWLHTSGSSVINEAGEPVRLRGFGLGGWMNMENFITGYPSSEVVHREEMRKVLGDELYERFFDAFLREFFNDADAQYLASIGVNSLRIPINYRHLQSDLRPGAIIESGFAHLDRAIQACAAHGIYSIIDLHSAPGGQNGHWHSDSVFHQPQLWTQRDFQDRTVAVWSAIADRYKDDPWVAGYNFLNEPGAENPRDLIELYALLESAVREIDSRHALFLDGNRFATEFPSFTEALPNTIYSVHQYHLPCGFDAPPYPGGDGGNYYDKARVEADFHRMATFADSVGAPLWVGEFGPVYTDEPDRDAMKRQLLIDEIDIYEQHGAGWALWTYKDMGVMGLVKAKPDSPWLDRTVAVRDKKARLGVDMNDSDDLQIADIMRPLVDRFAAEYPTFNPYPFGVRTHIDRLVRGILLGEPLAAEFAASFANITDADVDAIASSWALANSDINIGVERIVRDACSR